MGGTELDAETAPFTALRRNRYKAFGQMKSLQRRVGDVDCTPRAMEDIQIQRGPTEPDLALGAHP